MKALPSGYRNNPLVTRANALRLALRLNEVGPVLAACSAGLAGAAVTDTCAMGAVLSALPYNRGETAVHLDDVLQVLRSSTTDR